MVLGKVFDYCKLLSWMCITIVIANRGSVAFLRLMNRSLMPVAYAANVNDCKFGSGIILFIDNTHLSRLYKGTILAACALDVDNHLFNFSYAIVLTAKIDE